ncbi:COG4223 family protein [Parvularcula sp. IMCC14364]|uniref:COG4223 family protein n=1 Tax=Parvularcula sp. IMCC14364 TaxID=3067902 RepID=UPI00274144DF|nr:mitofilin family membrane protein [Parvularcula sp. IMCC14364]
MSNSDTPKKDDNGNTDDQPEQVEAEIIDSDDTDSGEEVTRLEGETVVEDEALSDTHENAGDEEEKSPQSFVTTGVILLGVMALALIVFFLMQGGEEELTPQTAMVEEQDLLAGTPVAAENSEPEADNPAVAGNALADAAETVSEAAEEMSKATVTTATQAAEIVENKTAEIIDQTGEAVDSVASVVSGAAEEVAETAEEIVTEVREEVQSLNPQDSVEADAARQAAIERNRARREARSGRSDGSEQDQDIATPTEDITTTQSEGATIENRTEPSKQNGETTSTPAPVADAATQAAADSKIDNAVIETVRAQAQDAQGVVSEAQLEDKLESIREDVLAETQAAMAADQKRITEQSSEIDRLRREMDQALAEQQRRAEQLEARLDTLQTRDVATATKQAALSIAVTNLQRQIGAGRPFAEQLNVLEQLAPNTSGLRDLEPYAEEGLPTVTSLRLRYADDARKALAAANRASENGFWGELGARFSGLFSVRKTGLVSGDSPSAIISRAEVSLDDGDISGALRQLDALEGEAAEVMAGWMEEARSLVSADQLLDEVSNRVLETL